MLLDIEKIRIEERARIALGDSFEDLKNSLAKRGQLHALSVRKEDFKLIAGFRRYTAMRELGFKEVKVELYENLTPEEEWLIELEENIHEPLLWHEKAKLHEQIHGLKTKLHGESIPGHSTDGQYLQHTADDLGVNIATLSLNLKLAKAMEDFPELKNLHSRNQAIKAMNRIHEVLLLQELAKRHGAQSFTDTPYLIFNKDCVEGIKEHLEDETVAMVMCDPPWGIDIDIIGTRKSGEKADYDDSWVTFIDLIQKLMPEIHRVMQEDGHMYYFFGITDYEFHYRLLSEGKIPNPKYSGPSIVDNKIVYLEPEFITVLEKPFFVEAVPCVWIKEGGGFTDWDHRPMPRYESLFFCSKGIKKQFNEVTSNVFEHNRTLPTDRVHPQEKPLDLLKKFISLSTQPNEIVLDPCAGSFVTAVAATMLNRKSISFELNKMYFAKGVERVSGMVADLDGEDTDADDD